MISHAPEGYTCPFRRLSRHGGLSPAQGAAGIDASTIVNSDVDVFAVIGNRVYGDIAMNVLVIPHRHVENVYALSEDPALPLHRLVRAVARACG
jgi:hypothetical protein